MFFKLNKYVFTPKVCLVFFIFSSTACLVKIYLSNLTTLTGYKIGRLKEQESQLLKEKNLATMKLTSMLRKKNLIKQLKR